MSSNTLLLSATLMSGYGTQGQSWRAPENATDAYTDMDAQVKLAHRRAGKFAFLFAPDFPGARQDMEFQAPSSTLDPIVTLSVLAHQDQPHRLCGHRLDDLQRALQPGTPVQGPRRAEPRTDRWNAVTTSDPIAVANYGEQVRARA